MSEQPLRFGLAGYGARGRHPAPSIATHPAAQLNAIISSSGREEIARCVEVVRAPASPTATGEDRLWSTGLLAEESIRQKRPVSAGDLLQV